MTYEIRTAFNAPDPIAQAALDQLLAHAGTLIGRCLGTPPAPVWGADNGIGTVDGASLSCDVPNEGAFAVSGTSHSTGKRAFKLRLSYPGDPGDQQVLVGIQPSGFPAYDSGALGVTTDAAMIGPLWSEAALLGKVNFATGKLWLGTESGFSGDPDNGSDPYSTFLPNTPMWLFAQATEGCIVVLEPYADGDWLAW
jgi:hypothetical protein